MAADNSRYQRGECIYVKGNIQRKEQLADGRWTYYMKEAPEVPILERDIIRYPYMDKLQAENRRYFMIVIPLVILVSLIIAMCVSLIAIM